MYHWLLLPVAAAGLAACASTPAVRPDERELSLEVAGFVQAEGIT